MNRSFAHRCSLFALLAAGCGNGTTTVARSRLDPLDVRILSHVPANALVVARLDAEALRRSSAWEAAAAVPSTGDARVWFESTDRIVFAIGPMLPAQGLLDPAPDDAAGEHVDPVDENAPLDGDWNDPADQDSVDDADALVDPDAGVASPDAGSAPSSTTTASALAPPVEDRDLETYRTWFGDSVPAFALIAASSGRTASPACSRMRSEITTPLRRVGNAEVHEERGIAIFFVDDGTCGVSSANWLADVIATRPRFAAPVERMVRAGHDGDLGVFGYATEGSGVVRDMIAHASPSLGATERRVVDWLGKVLDILRRGMRGSAGAVWLEDGRLEIESSVEYSDTDHAIAHRVVADTTRELIQVTAEALASQFEGSFPTDVTDNLRIERDDLTVTMHWDVSEESLAEFLRQVMSGNSAEESPLLAGMQEGFAFAQAATVLPGPAVERIALLEPRRAELETSDDRADAEALISLAEAYTTRGRWDDARSVLDGVRERALADADVELVVDARVGQAGLELARGDRVAAVAVVTSALETCDVESCGVFAIELRLLAARLAREDGRTADAIALLDRVDADFIDESDATRVAIERLLLRAATGEIAEARRGLTDLSRLAEHMTMTTGRAHAELVEARIALALAPRQSTTPADLVALRTSILVRVPYATEDNVASFARARLLECRLLRLEPDAAAREALEETCEYATSEAVNAHGDHHPAVAEAFVARAEALLARREAASATTALASAEAALEGLPTHPLRARITALRGRRGR